jgi:hypothetical protein
MHLDDNELKKYDLCYLKEAYQKLDLNTRKSIQRLTM